MKSRYMIIALGALITGQLYGAYGLPGENDRVVTQGKGLLHVVYKASPLKKEGPSILRGARRVKAKNEASLLLGIRYGHVQKQKKDSLQDRFVFCHKYVKKPMRTGTVPMVSRGVKKLKIRKPLRPVNTKELEVAVTLARMSPIN